MLFTKNEEKTLLDQNPACSVVVTWLFILCVVPSQLSTARRARLIIMRSNWGRWHWERDLRYVHQICIPRATSAEEIYDRVACRGWNSLGNIWGCHPMLVWCWADTYGAGPTWSQHWFSASCLFCQAPRNSVFLAVSWWCKTIRGQEATHVCDQEDIKGHSQKYSRC